MRSKVRRQLGELLGEDTAARATKTLLDKAKGGKESIVIPPEFTPHQYAIFLLHVAAEIEHSLMVEYLYAGYSLGGPSVPSDKKAEVAQWQETILGVAKEEMGHLITVQNLLRCLGGPLNLDREDYPWDSGLYPFAFKLGPLTRQSLATYVYAESPDPDLWNTDEAKVIKKLATEESEGQAIHRVGALYRTIECMLESPDLVEDARFRGSTFVYQANWDEWGRGYRAGDRGNTRSGSMPGTPDVIVMPATSRTEALAALDRVATQGEANSSDSATEPSHFARFLGIFREFPKASEWSPARNVAVNPFVSVSSSDAKIEQGRNGTQITSDAGILWAHLFNVRYRLLLTNLVHSFEYPNNIVPDTQWTPRGLLIHSTFGEMYNIRAISQILMQTPLAAGVSEEMAGPPFQLPYTLKLPVDLEDRWQLHLDSLQQSTALAATLLSVEGDQHKSYLQSLQSVDSQTSKSIEALLAGHAGRHLSPQR